MKTLTKSFAILLMMMLAVSCAKDEGFLPVEDELSDALKGAATFDGTYVLEGSTHFPSYAVKEHKVISPWEVNFLTCEATLSIDGHQMTLETLEYFDLDLVRKVTFQGKISSGGVVKFSWPDKWWEITGDKTIDMLDDQIRLHTGCIVYGPGKGHGLFRLHYKGKFDGENFYASAHFMGKQEDFGVVPFYGEDYLNNVLGIEGLIEGPIQFEFTMELLTE